MPITTTPRSNPPARSRRSRSLTGTDVQGVVTLARYWVTRHRILSLVLALLAAVALAAALRLSAAPTGDAPSVAPTATAPSPDARPDRTLDQTRLPDDGIPRSSDPDVFARGVAEAVFTWDTSSPSLPDVTERLLVVADPTGEETPGLLVDLRTYLPSDQAWTHLAQYRTRQWIEVSDVVEPAQWGEAVAQAPEGALGAGTTARTVTGVRHRAGTWDGEPATASSQVRFTVFLVCAPTHDTCHLLRLSTPGLALH
ncbi:hypothetical protein ACFT2C_04650 [Promicromonospora sp. NPDC057138]|uniref:hypothetical protein n=1 Tax=Promicromonospora sp. NPDC057138 TaxID=3346031 RepID=UPI00362573B4